MTGITNIKVVKKDSIAFLAKKWQYAFEQHDAVGMIGGLELLSSFVWKIIIWIIFLISDQLL